MNFRKSFHVGLSLFTFESRLQISRIFKNGSGFNSICRSISNENFKWSPLATASNSLGSLSESSGKKVGLFGNSDFANEASLRSACKRVSNEVQTLLTESLNRSRTRKLVSILDHMSDNICQIADSADFLRLSHPQARFRATAEQVYSELCTLVESLNTDAELYAECKRVLNEGEVQSAPALDATDRRVLQLLVFDFEQTGVHLNQSVRGEFVKCNSEIIRASGRFQEGLLSPRSVHDHKLPMRLRKCLPTASGVVTLAGGAAGEWLEHANEAVREAAYRVYYGDAASTDGGAGEQERALLELLAQRHRLAALAGFSSFGERSVRATMAESRDNVLHFLTGLSSSLKPFATRDYDLMRSIKASLTTSTTQQVNMWDVSYLSNLLRQQSFGALGDTLPAYLTLGGCLQGLDELLCALFGTRLRFVPASAGELWHPSVFKLEVVDEKEMLLGCIYCDFFERPDKPLQDCHFTIRGGRELPNGSYQSPIVVLMLNLSRGPLSSPPMLNIGQLTNMFHEFGHAMHSMLGRTRYQHVTGTRCPTDFAEIPSQLLESFLRDPRVLTRVARHWSSGDPLPTRIALHLAAVQNVFHAADLESQCLWATLDQEYHGPDAARVTEAGGTSALLERVHARSHSLPFVRATAPQLRFGHLLGYAARYYSYLAARAAAFRLWTDLFEREPYDRSAGDKYRSRMLAFGGEKRSFDILSDVLGGPTNMASLSTALVAEAERANIISSKLFGRSASSSPISSTTRQHHQ